MAPRPHGGREPRGAGGPPVRTGAWLEARTACPPELERRLRLALGRIARRAARSARRPVALSVALLGDREARRLNRERLAHDHVPDVLAFALEDGPAGLRGDLALSLGVARREAARRGHPAYDELILYAVHGTLHLLGHDDLRPDARARMRAAERRWLGALGLGDVYGAGPPPRRRRAR